MEGQKPIDVLDQPLTVLTGQVSDALSHIGPDPPPVVAITLHGFLT
jgi:hypothetical protein